MVQVSILLSVKKNCETPVFLQPHRIVVANFVPGNFGLFRFNAWQPFAEPWGSAGRRLKNIELKAIPFTCQYLLISVWNILVVGEAVTTKHYKHTAEVMLRPKENEERLWDYLHTMAKNTELLVHFVCLLIFFWECALHQIFSRTEANVHCFVSILVLIKACNDW